MEKELKTLRRQVSLLESFISDNIARILFERIISTYKEHKKLISVLKHKVDGGQTMIRDDFTRWVDYIEPRIALDVMNSNFQWNDLRDINGLVDSLCEMYYNFDLYID